MEDEKTTMSQRQLQKFQVLHLVLVGKITLKEGGEKIGVAYRWSSNKGSILVDEK
jgi:hypothetical protein